LRFKKKIDHIPTVLLPNVPRNDIGYALSKIYKDQQQLSKDELRFYLQDTWRPSKKEEVPQSFHSKKNKRVARRITMDQLT